jgi:tetratricopeptide (TPR) repeat protein
MKKTNSQKWVFTSRFRTNAYGWKGSKLACKRIKEAVSEIKKVARKDPVFGAEGSISFMERLWPALQHVNSSSGALGTAVFNAMDVLVYVVVNAPADEKTRGKWLARLWDAINEDGVGFLDNLGERWGEVCGSALTASKWADELLPIIRHCWEETRHGSYSYFKGTSACLSCLLASGRYQELLDLLELAPHISWYNRKYGVQALVAMGKKGEAIKYARASCGLNDSRIAIDQACEDILLSSGLYEEAYQTYGLAVNMGGTNFATFRNIAKKYPMKDQVEILKDLIESTPGEEGKWFATAKTVGQLALALKLAYRSPCEPKTLNRAARDYLHKNPKFALGVAIASLHWLAEGWGYEITPSDVYSAYDYALKAAENLGITDQVKADIAKIVRADKSPGRFVKEILRRHLNL